ncbi:MAG TPA: hypothetical protein VFJ80_01890 [Candidatus Limnocylindrales bacterium]|jgi:hypothetical protein|nr:hypothetical protein [Candidatus Limnocylindrales bacterium]
MEHEPLSDDVLDHLEALSSQGSPKPWRSMVEGRDHISGDSFIQIGEGAHRLDDMFVSRDRGPADHADLDLIAAARNYLPDLIAELRRLRAGSRARDL